MKRSISKFLAILLAFMFVFQTSFVALADDEPDWEDISLTQKEFDDILALNQSSQNTSMNGHSETLASGLIFSYAIGITSSGTNLIIAGKTNCNPEVIKCGFKTIVIQRRTSSTQSWSNYKTYSDLYNNYSSYTLSKTVAVASGYQYRVTCKHYAKKSLLSTQTIDNTSNVIAIG